MTDNRSWRGKSTLAICSRRTVSEALDAATQNHLTVHEVRLARELPNHFKNQIHEHARQLGADASECKPAAVRELSRDPRHDQGIAALVTLNRVTDASDFAASLHGPRAAAPTRVIALDGLTNPQNIGMTVRAAVAAGFHAVLWPLEGCPWISGLLIKASAATLFRTTIATCADLTEGLDALAQHGFSIAGLTADADTPLWQHRPAHRACYVTGSETQGLAPATADRLDTRLAIPMQNDVESLNAATAAAILAFHVARHDTQRDPKPAPNDTTSRPLP